MRHRAVPHHMPGRCWCHARGRPSLQICELNWLQFLANYTVAGISLYNREWTNNTSITGKLLEQHNLPHLNSFPLESSGISCGKQVSPGSWWLLAFPAAARHLLCTARPGGLLADGISVEATEALNPSSPCGGGRIIRHLRLPTKVASFITMHRISQGSPVGKTEEEKNRLGR